MFDITKTGKVAGCMVTEGLVKRGAGVRLLRDNVVIHNGELSQLKRFKDDVREVARGYECGLSFANFHDLQEGDVVECFEIGDGAGLKQATACRSAREREGADASGSCAWRRKSATCWPASSRAANSAIPIWRTSLITVTEVRIGPDLKHATAFVTRLGRSDVAELLPALQRAAPFLRGQVAQIAAAAGRAGSVVPARHQLDYAMHVDELLRAPEVARDLSLRPGSKKAGALPQTLAGLCLHAQGASPLIP